MQRTQINGGTISNLDASDRGLAFGDGLFETMRVCQGRIPLLDRHLRRLSNGCARLSIACDVELVGREIDAFLSHIDAPSDDAVLKLILTRGVGGVGYRCPDQSHATRVLRYLPPRNIDPNDAQHGVGLFACQTRLSVQPLLAGIKHLNRLEQVMARREWTDAVFFDGLMFDMDDRVVECVSSNIFIVKDGALVTPSLTHCGVQGVLRELIMDALAPAAGLRVVEQSVTREQLVSADEVFICNSVIGLLPVNAFDRVRWAVGPISRLLQRAVNDAFA